MKSVEFCYWLQGFFELGKPATLNEEQTALVIRHLNMVFIHEIDPSLPASQRPALDLAHRPVRPEMPEPQELVPPPLC